MRESLQQAAEDRGKFRSLRNHDRSKESTKELVALHALAARCQSWAKDNLSRKTSSDIISLIDDLAESVQLLIEQDTKGSTDKAPEGTDSVLEAEAVALLKAYAELEENSARKQLQCLLKSS